MKRIRVTLLVLSVFCAGQARSLAQPPNAPRQSVESPGPLPPQQIENTGTGSPVELAAIRGTVTDVNDQAVADATVTLLDSDLNDVRTVTTDGLGFFAIDNLEPGVTYRIAISAAGFARWESPETVLQPGEHEVLDVSKLRIEELQTTVTVRPEGTEEMAIEQVKVEEKQRGFGIIPNFFAVYDPHPAPLTAKLKFDLALRVLRDPFTLGGVAVLAGLGQAAGSPAYVQGLRGYGERFGATYANQFSSVMIGGAVLPALLRQDPRYFYQGRGSKASRALHALSNLVITKSDGGRTEPNFSSLGGDLASAAIANAYYPERDEAARYVFESFAVNTAVHAAVRLLQEFAFRPQKGTVVSDPGGDAGGLTPPR